MTLLRAFGYGWDAPGGNCHICSDGGQSSGSMYMPGGVWYNNGFFDTGFSSRKLPIGWQDFSSFEDEPEGVEGSQWEWDRGSGCLLAIGNNAMISWSGLPFPNLLPPYQSFTRDRPNPFGITNSEIKRIKPSGEEEVVPERLALRNTPMVSYRYDFDMEVPFGSNAFVFFDIYLGTNRTIHGFDRLSPEECRICTKSIMLANGTGSGSSSYVGYHTGRKLEEERLVLLGDSNTTQIPAFKTASIPTGRFTLTLYYAPLFGNKFINPDQISGTSPVGFNFAQDTYTTDHGGTPSEQYNYSFNPIQIQVFIDGEYLFTVLDRFCKPLNRDDARAANLFVSHLSTKPNNKDYYDYLVANPELGTGFANSEEVDGIVSFIHRYDFGDHGERFYKGSQNTFFGQFGSIGDNLKKQGRIVRNESRTTARFGLGATSVSSGNPVKFYSPKFTICRNSNQCDYYHDEWTSKALAGDYSLIGQPWSNSDTLSRLGNDISAPLWPFDGSEPPSQITLVEAIDAFREEVPPSRDIHDYSQSTSLERITYQEYLNFLATANDEALDENGEKIEPNFVNEEDLDLVNFDFKDCYGNDTIAVYTGEREAFQPDHEDNPLILHESSGGDGEIPKTKMFVFISLRLGLPELRDTSENPLSGLTPRGAYRHFFKDGTDSTARPHGFLIPRQVREMMVGRKFCWVVGAMQVKTNHVVEGERVKVWNQSFRESMENTAHYNSFIGTHTSPPPLRIRSQAGSESGGGVGDFFEPTGNGTPPAADNTGGNLILLQGAHRGSGQSESSVPYQQEFWMSFNRLSSSIIKGEYEYQGWITA